MMGPRLLGPGGAHTSRQDTLGQILLGEGSCWRHGYVSAASAAVTLITLYDDCLQPGAARRRLMREDVASDERRSVDCSGQSRW